MPGLGVNQRELRRAMRDPRYSKIGDREHGAYRAWVTEGFQALQAASPGEGGTVTGGGRLEHSNIIAGLGGAWSYGPAGRADEFINAPVPHAAFGAMVASPTTSGRSILDVARAP